MAKLSKIQQEDASESKGLFFQPGSKNYWFRYTLNGRQERVSLRTTAKDEAKRKRKEILQRVESKKTEEAWEYAVESYVAKKLKDGEFRPSSGENSRYALKKFKELFPSVKNPIDVSQSMVGNFYKIMQRDNGNESTAQSYTKKVLAFLRFQGFHFEEVKYTGDLETRKTVVSREDIESLIGSCGVDGINITNNNPEMAFILYCGFHAGLRRNEIGMLRKKYIQLNGPEYSKICLPKYDKETGFRTKSNRSREVPITPEFYSFLEFSWREWMTRDFILAPENNTTVHLKRKYRYDFRRPFEKFMDKHYHTIIHEDETESKNSQTCSVHCMRHSYVTHLLQDGIPPSVVAVVAGDREETIYKHYAHVQAKAFDIAEALSSLKRTKKPD